MWIEYNPNPAGRSVGDCAVRAIAKALDVDWKKAFALIVNASYQMADMPSSNAVWGSVLYQHGFERKTIDSACPDCYTAEDFLNDCPDQLNMANLAASQIAQTSQIRAGQAATAQQVLQEMRSCPVPSMPVYGMTPIFSCPQNNNCGCGCNA